MNIANQQKQLKTRILIIGIIAAIIVSSTFVYLYDQMYDCLNPPVWIKHPRHYGLDDCLRMYLDGTLPDYTQARRTMHKSRHTEMR